MIQDEKQSSKKSLENSESEDIKKTSRVVTKEKIPAKPSNDIKSKSVQGYKLQKKKKKITIKDIFNKIKNEKNKYKLILITVALAISIILLVILINFVLTNIRYGKFNRYQDKVNEYGFSNIYNNKSASTKENVTKLEAIKLVISSILNTDDISGIASGYDDYDGETWVKYAEFFNILSYDEINKENKDELVKYYELVKYFTKAKEVFISSQDSSNENIVLKNAAKYDKEIQIAFSDLVRDKIIETETQNIDGQQIVFKGLANELMVNFLEKYFRISIENARLRVNEMPKNSEEYPYILFDVSQKIYEYDFEKKNADFKNPRVLYKDKKADYELIKENIENYFENLYSIDYKNLKPESLKLYLDMYSGNTNSINDIKEFTAFAIKNKVETQAQVKMIEPCIYYDGENYRVRIEITLKIISGETRENLLIGDSKFGKVLYDKDEYKFYYDAKFNISEELRKIYITTPIGLANEILNKKDISIKLEQGGGV